MSDDTTPTVTTNIEGEIPDTWTDEDEQRIKAQLGSLASSIEEQLAAGKTIEEIVDGWKAYAEEHGITDVDMSADEDGIKIHVAPGKEER